MSQKAVAVDGEVLEARHVAIASGSKQTIAALLDHGNIVPETVKGGIEEARGIIESLDRWTSALPMLPHDWNGKA